MKRNIPLPTRTRAGGGFGVLAPRAGKAHADQCRVEVADGPRIGHDCMIVGGLMFNPNLVTSKLRDQVKRQPNDFEELCD